MAGADGVEWARRQRLVEHLAHKQQQCRLIEQQGLACLREGSAAPPPPACTDLLKMQIACYGCWLLACSCSASHDVRLLSWCSCSYARVVWVASSMDQRAVVRGAIGEGGGVPAPEQRKERGAVIGVQGTSAGAQGVRAAAPPTLQAGLPPRGRPTQQGETQPPRGRWIPHINSRVRGVFGCGGAGCGVGACVTIKACPTQAAKLDACIAASGRELDPHAALGDHVLQGSGGV